MRPTYRLRPATLQDSDALVHQRRAMFTDMGMAIDASTFEPAFRAWLARLMPEGTYRAWLAETEAGSGDPQTGGIDTARTVASAAPTGSVDGARIVAGGGMTIIPWPPGPRYPGDRLAFVYNVYTEPAHRGRGLARRLMMEMHAWCRDNGITSLALNASQAGEPLYRSLGYAVTTSPMMFFALD